MVSIDHAKRVCDECTVTDDCLDFALETNQDSGIWGGLSEEERRAIGFGISSGLKMRSAA